MSKSRTKLIGVIATVFSMVGVLGMILLYQGAHSPCLAPTIRGMAGSENVFPIGTALDGSTIKIDILSAAKMGPAFVLFGLLWVVGAVLVRILLGWGNLVRPSQRVKLLGVCGAVFQILGGFIFLYSAWGIVELFEFIKAGQGTTPDSFTLSYGLSLRSTLSGLTTFGIGNLMTVIFLKYAMEEPGTAPSSQKRRIVSSLSFVPMAIAAVALGNVFFQLLEPESVEGPLLAALSVGFALPMVVGSIPLLVNSNSIPGR